MTGPSESDQVTETRARKATGAEILRRRTALGMTQAELSGRSGVSAAVIGRWERGNAVLVDLWQLRALGAALGVSAGTLVDAGRHAVTGEPGGRGSVFVLRAGPPPGPRPELPPACTYWRLTEWTPHELAAHGEPPTVTEHDHAEHDHAEPDHAEPDHAEPDRRTVGPTITQWASQVLGGQVMVIGSATDLTGASRSWYVSTVAPWPAPDDSRGS